MRRARSGFERRPKRNAILSVGRFATTGTGRRSSSSWSSHSPARGEGPGELGVPVCGGLGRWRKISGTSTASGRSVLLRCPDGRESPLVAIWTCSTKRRGDFFWHGAGLGEQNPVLLEHFGLVTVEAMAAGCVPVVVASGGQTEIVQHGVNGYLWTKLEEARAVYPRPDQRSRPPVPDVRSGPRAGSGTSTLRRLRGAADGSALPAAPLTEPGPRISGKEPSRNSASNADSRRPVPMLPIHLAASFSASRSRCPGIPSNRNRLFSMAGSRIMAGCGRGPRASGGGTPG